MCSVTRNFIKVGATKWRVSSVYVSAASPEVEGTYVGFKGRNLRRGIDKFMDCELMNLK
jgi:hypothetical protein